jgi:hypothetical protein
MFDGTLGVYPHKKVHIDIDPNAKPVHSRPYPIPQIHLKTFKIEFDHLVRIGVLASQQKNDWTSPAKLGSRGKKDITKVMAITNRNGKGDHSNPVRGTGYLDTCKYPAG